MKEKFVGFFTKRHLLTNFITILVYVGGIFAWINIQKEAFPNISFDVIHISASYSGASPEEIEYFVAIPIEEKVKGVSGVEDIESTCSEGSCSITVSLLNNLPNKDDVIEEIKDAARSADLPSDVDEPNVHEMKFTEIPVLRIAVIDTNAIMLTADERTKLQGMSDILENRLSGLPEISRTETRNYRDKEIRIVCDPKKLEYLNLSYADVVSALSKNNVRTPIGSLDTTDQEQISVLAELNQIEDIKNVIIRGSFSGAAPIRIKDVAIVSNTFEDTTSITRVNGYEAYFVTVSKSQNYDLLQAKKAIMKVINAFNNDVLSDTTYKTVILRDESKEISMRLQTLANNGMYAFLIITILLFIFLDVESGVWAALGIPFSFALTLILMPVFGLTINNLTLASMLVVSGMIVDDAIVITENITRLRARGVKNELATSRGVSDILLSVIASSFTTIVAFIPFIFFTGRYGIFASMMPYIVGLMLCSSLFESIIILPSHMNVRFSEPLKDVLTLGIRPLVRIIKEKVFKQKIETKPEAVIVKNEEMEMEELEVVDTPQMHWFHKIEHFYGNLIKKVLPYRYIVIIGAFVLLGASVFIFTKTMKFVMFPQAETTQIFCSIVAPEGTTREDMAHRVESVERMLDTYLSGDVVTYQTTIAQSRRGSVSEDNKAYISIEIQPYSKRKKSISDLINEWEIKTERFVIIQTNASSRRLATAMNAMGGPGGGPGGPPPGVNMQQQLTPQQLRQQERQRARIRRKIERETGITLTNGQAPTPPERLAYFTQLKFTRQQFGANSGSPIEVRVSEDNDRIREAAAQMIATALSNNSEIKEADVQTQPLTTQYKIHLKRAELNRLDISPSEVGTVLRTALTGSEAYEYHEGDKTIKVNVIGSAKYREDIDTLLNSLIPNNSGYQVPLRNVISIEKTKGYTYISREKYSRAINIYSDLNDDTKKTPLEIANWLEKEVFPAVYKEYPTVNIAFTGEIEESRAAENNFAYAVFFAIFLIYGMIAILYNSLTKPFIIMLIIPLSIIGVVLTLLAHGMFQVGFFIAVGTIGLSGVVVNDSIYMVTTLDNIYKKHKKRPKNSEIAIIAQTRLRAIFLTTVTTFGGLLPTGYGLGGYDNMVSQMMVVFAWGLLFATTLTLFFTPCMYSILVNAEADTGDAFKSLFQKISAKRGAKK